MEKLQPISSGFKDKHRVLAVVQDWFSTHSQWLLIWDNVEDLDLLDHFLLSSRQGAILITTRCQVLGTVAQGIDLFPMKQEEGILFLLRRAKILELQATVELIPQLAVQMPYQYEAAAELVTVMGGLPLALDQAGAYIEETQCGLRAYLELFRTRRATLLHQRGDRSRDHLESVATTFALAITATARHHPAVEDLLRACALLQSEAIPEELFRQGAEHLGIQLKNICRDALDWNRVVAGACSYSLLQRQPEEQTFSIHRLVQATFLDTMTEEEQEQWNRRVIRALDMVFPEVLLVSAYAAWKQAERLLPHTLLCLSRARTTSRSTVFASLAYKAAQYLRERGQYTQAEPLFLQALHIREQLLGPDHPEIASSLNALAALYWNLGKYEQAEQLLQRALHIWEQSLGPDHPEVARPLNNLGLIYGMQGKYEQAEPLLLRALHIWEQSLGTEHPLVADALHNLAELSRDQGKYEQAESLFLRVLHIREQLLGAEHPLVASALHDLAEAYLMQSNYAQAEPLYQRALSIREQSLGYEHALVAEPLNGLANLSRDQSNYAQAESLYQRALSIREQSLGQQHPETAQTLHDLALLHQKQGNLCEARSLAERALHIRIQSLGDAHLKTISTRTLSAQLEQQHRCPEKSASSPSHTVEAPEAEDLQGSLSASTHITNDAASEHELFQEFLRARCKLHPRAWSRSRDLWGTYEQWAAEHHERFPLSRRAFTIQLKEHGCLADRTRTTRIWRGISIVTAGDSR